MIVRCKNIAVTIDEVQAVKIVIQVNGNNCEIINGIHRWLGDCESKGLNRADTFNQRVRSYW